MSIGHKLGRAIGTLGALAVEGSVRGATGLGKFGEDVLAGTTEGYEEKAAALLAQRLINIAAREERIAALRLAHAAAMEAPAAPATPKAPRAKKLASA